MNIVYVHQHFSTVRGRTGTRSYDFAHHLVNCGHRVTVVTGVYGPSDLADRPLDSLVTRTMVDGIDVCIVNVRHDNKQTFWRRIASFLFFMAVSTREVLRVRDADVVFATSTPLTTGFSGMVDRVFRRVPFVFEVRDIWPETAVDVGVLTNPLFIRLAEGAERMFYRTAFRIVAVSHRMGDRLKARIGADAPKVRVIMLGTDYDLIAGAEPDLAWRREHGLEGKFVAIYAGAHGRVNALGRVLKAAALLKDDPHIHIVLVGDGAMKASLVAQAEREGLDNVLLLDGMAKERLASVLRTCDAGLMTLENVPVFSTVCPNKFQDYLAASLPVIVNFEGEVAWYCRRDGCGLVVSADDAKALADAIRQLASSPNEAREMGRRGQALAAREFDRRHLAKDLEAVLTEACRSRPRCGRHGT